MNNEATKSSGRKAAIRASVALGIFLALTVGLYLAAPGSFYIWAKAFHVIAIISWMAGMVYLPRIFVYHAGAEAGSESSETFKIMERRLLRIIMNPAMIISWVFGLWLAIEAGFFGEIWFWIKFAAVVGMSYAHGVLAKGVRLFAEDRNEKSPRYWRMFNEVPTVLMIIIVIMVIVKPFG